MRVAALVIALLTLPQGAAAQPDPQAEPAPRFLVEFGVGALGPQPPTVVEVDEVDPSDTRVAIGGRFGWYPGGRGFVRRLRLELTAHYASLGSSEYFDPGLGSFARFEGHWVAVTPAVALDVVRAPRFVLDARVGPTLVTDAVTFLLEREVEDEDEGEGAFENVCDLRAFDHNCTERFRAAAAVGAGARWVVRPAWDMYIGVDYTWLSLDRHVLLGTVGWRMR